MPVLWLNKREERRIIAGHLWVFSNEVDQKKSPLKTFQSGQFASLMAASGKSLGLVYVNPHSLICARLVTRKTDLKFDTSFIKHRLNIALSLRQRLFSEPFYRLVYGDSDFLPGLVIDRYDDKFVVQIGTAGMESLKTDIVKALKDLFKPQLIVFRNDSRIREMENLPLYKEVAYSTLTEFSATSQSIPLQLIENNATFRIDVLTGQKTGWFYDHRMNRQRLLNYVKGKTVLDLFSYVGGWSIQAAVAGAKQVTAVDSSAKAIELLKHNAQQNNCQQVSAIVSDVFDYLKQLREEKQKFDIVIVDPPAFIKRKKDLRKGSQAYLRLNQMAMQVCEHDAILVSASCSHHLSKSSLLNILSQAARHIDRDLQVLESGQQGPDHPIHPAIVETDYIKSYITRVLRR